MHDRQTSSPPAAPSAAPPSAHVPELLAPAGGWEAMKAAVCNGADAVYFGLEDFNARRRAENFTLQTLPDVLDYLHNHNVRGYLAMNTLLLPGELERAGDAAARAAECGVDAVIVQDLGLARLIHRMVPGLPLHASTQMTLTGPRSIELARRLGICRCILARELGLAEIRRLAEAGMELEVFVHGALCVSYSGQCLASLTLCQRRSANRGQCAQPCRMPYQMIVDGQPDWPQAERPFVLSPKDLCAWELAGDLARAGVAGLKIEGRLKGPHYVAAAVQAYRRALDELAAGRTASMSPRERAALSLSFSRGFTRGFLAGTNHLSLVDGRSPKSRGAAIGRVASIERRGIAVALNLEPGQEADEVVRPGDGVIFEADEKAPGQEPGGRVYEVLSRRTPGQVLLTFANEADLRGVAAGQAVRKTDDPRLERELETSYARWIVRRPTRLDVHATARVGGPLRLAAVDADGLSGEVSGEAPLEAARKHPLTAETLREQLDRLGETPFVLGQVTLEGEGAMAPKSVVNDLRRRLVDAMLQRRRDARRHAVAAPAALKELREEAASLSSTGPVSAPASETGERESISLHVLVRSAEQAEAALDVVERSRDRHALPRAIQTLYLDLRDAAPQDALAERCRRAALKFGLATPRIARSGEQEWLERIVQARPNAILVRNLEALGFLAQRRGEGQIDPACEVVGDFSLNAANELTAAVLADQGLARVTASLDLGEEDLMDLAGRFPPRRLEVLLQGRVPLFHTEHCLFAARLARQTDRTRCGGPCRRHRLALRDYAGAEHPVLADAACRNTVFAAEPLARLQEVPTWSAAGMRHFRIEFLEESPEEIARTLARTMQA